MFSRYMFNSFPVIAPLRQERNASNHFLPQQNSCGNLKYCGMPGQVTAWSLSFSLKWNNYPFVYGTNSTTKQSLECANTSGEESLAPVTLPTTATTLHADTATHLYLAISNALPTTNKMNSSPRSLLRTGTKATATGATVDCPLPEETPLQQ